MKKFVTYILCLLLLITVGCKKDSNSQRKATGEYIIVNGTRYNLDQFQYSNINDPYYEYNGESYYVSYQGKNGGEDLNNNTPEGNYYYWSVGLLHKSTDGSFGNTRNLTNYYITGNSDLTENTGSLNNTNCSIRFTFGDNHYNGTQTSYSQLEYFSKANGTCTYSNGYVHFSGTFDAGKPVNIGNGIIKYTWYTPISVEAYLKINPNR